MCMMRAVTVLIIGGLGSNFPWGSLVPRPHPYPYGEKGLVTIERFPESVCHVTCNAHVITQRN